MTLPPDESNPILAERDEAISALKPAQAAAERRIAGLESELRASQQAGDELEDRAGREAEFQAALARFQATPHARTKAQLDAWMRSRGLTTTRSQIAYLGAVLRSRGHGV